MENNINNLIEMSHFIGNNTAYIQGGGGNTSFKTENTLWIKASGSLLKNINKKTGIAKLDLNKVKIYLENPDNDENLFAGKIKNFALNQNKPSIETGFHAVIPYPYVIHSHSVYINVAACSLEVNSILDKVFGTDYILVPYATPGIELITAYIHALSGKNIPKAIILQNHGIITYGNTYKEAIENHEYINTTIKHILNLKDFNLYSNNIYKNHGYLFPDQVVYFENNNAKDSTAHRETILAYNYIYDNIVANNLTPNFIPQNKIDAITDMESEKYRSQLIHKEG